MKPILYNTPMVRAILDRLKTQTRRVVKPQPHGVLTKAQALARAMDGTDPYGFRPYPLDTEIAAKAPYQPGDVLWVRETWAENTIPHSGNYAGIEYRADYYGGEEPILRWRPSIHMPREAARIFLRVTDVRVERLQDMTEDDAFAEGYKGCPAEHTRYFPEGGAEPCFNLGICPFQYWYCQHSDPEGFGRDIWDKTVKPADRDCYGWAANPWVWVYTFERIEKEDAER